MMKGRTPDEKFLIQAYKMAQELGNVSAHIDFRKIALAIGQKETAAKNIVKSLAQANLIKKIDGFMIALTSRGCDFVLKEIS